VIATEELPDGCILAPPVFFSICVCVNMSSFHMFSCN
jgi:hypothetical protein